MPRLGKAEVVEVSSALIAAMHAVAISEVAKDVDVRADVGGQFHALEIGAGVVRRAHLARRRIEPREVGPVCIEVRRLVRRHARRADLDRVAADR